MNYAKALLVGLLGFSTVAIVRAEAPASRPVESRFSRLFAAPAGTATKPTGHFNASFFEYKHVTPEVAWATPTQQQIMIYGRPPQTLPELKPAADINALPEPLRYANVDIRWFAYRGEGNVWVPALLATPQGKTGPFPLVIATHGLLSHKRQVLSQVGPSLLEKGFAVLAIDLPFHGERAGWPLEILNRNDPSKMIAAWRQAVINIRQAIDVGQSLNIIDHSQAITAVGYSLGSWMSTLVGAADPRIAAMVLMVGGATDLAPDLLAVPAIAASDPRNAVAAFAPRPLLMMNARNDRTVTPSMAQRLFDAAAEPKELRWYDMGHILKDPAYKEAANWIEVHRKAAATTANN